LRLVQKDVAQQIGVSEATIYNWERNANSPQIHDLPEIIRFLGYNPLPTPKSFPERLLSARKILRFFGDCAPKKWPLRGS